MGKVKLKYTYLAKGRYWRFRHPKVGDHALPGVPTDAQFHEAYGRRLAQAQACRALPPPSRDKFEWLIAQYLASPEYRHLAESTQIDYARTLDIIRAKLGDQPFAHTTRPMIKAVRDLYAANARKANKIPTMVSRLYSWGAESGHVEEDYNPVTGLKKLKPRGGTREYTCWSDREIARYLAHCPDHATTIVLLALHTGQRAIDVAAMKWCQFDGERLRVRQFKTGAYVEIKAHTRLRNHLLMLQKQRGSTAREEDFICLSAAGNPYQANSLGKAVSDAGRRVPGMPSRRTVHGLRYSAGAQMAEAGCTVAEIVSVLGHRTHQMGLKYASQRLRAETAHAKMEATFSGAAAKIANSGDCTANS